MLHIDLTGGDWKPISDLLHTLRPDLVLVDRSKRKLNMLELTVCHETNLQKSKRFKADKYASQFDYCTADYLDYSVYIDTIETTTLGFISDITQFCNANLKQNMLDSVYHKIVSSVISDTFTIYCNRNDRRAKI